MRQAYSLILLILLSSCARVVSPSGGPKDETPPVIVLSSPANHELNVSSKEIRIEFDEYIKEFSANDIIISPFQAESPELQFIGRSVIIKFAEDLEPNTTYSIDFNGAIKDFRQDNVIETLDYAFSTGAILDTAQLQGRLVDAETGATYFSETVRVMAYPLGDSLIYKEPPRYLATVDSSGIFQLKNMGAGKYNLYALEDQNFNNYFDQIGEAIAFLDEPIATADSAAGDINLFVHLTQDSIIWLENSNKLKDGQGQLIFSKKYQDIEIENSDELYIERSAANDTLSIWYTNKQLQSRSILGNGAFIDSLYFKESPDSLGTHQNFKFAASRLKTNEAPLELKFKHPISIVDDKLIEVYRDSIKMENPDDIDYSVLVNNRSLEIEIEPVDTSRYYALVYPNALENYFGYQNTDTLSHRFQKSTFDSRGALVIDFSTPETEQYFIELLLNKKLRYTFPLNRGKNKFDKIAKGTYSARLIKDDNENGIWDTGNIYDRKQPERVIVLETPFQVQSGWENEFVLDLESLL